MKTVIAILAVVVVAAVIVYSQWMLSVGTDDFSDVIEGYKVYRYGFPFRVVACAIDIPTRTPSSQTAWRVAGNFVVYFVCGLAVAGFVRRRRGHSL